MTERGNTLLQRCLQNQGEEAKEHVTADDLVELMEDRPGEEEVLNDAEGLLHRPQLLVADHASSGLRSLLVRSTKMPSNFFSSSILSGSIAKCSSLIVFR